MPKLDEAKSSTLAARPRTPELPPRSRLAGEPEEQAPPEGAALVGRRVCVWWEGDRKWFAGLVDAHDAEADPPTHHVHYDDGDERIYQLELVRWHLEGQAGIGEAGLSDSIRLDSIDDMYKCQIYILLSQHEASSLLSCSRAIVTQYVRYRHSTKLV